MLSMPNSLLCNFFPAISDTSHCWNPTTDDACISMQDIELEVIKTSQTDITQMVVSYESVRPFQRTHRGRPTTVVSHHFVEVTLVPVLINLLKLEIWKCSMEGREDEPNTIYLVSN